MYSKGEYEKKRGKMWWCKSEWTESKIEAHGWLEGWINTGRWHRKRWRLSFGLGVQENPPHFFFPRTVWHWCMCVHFVERSVWGEGDWDGERGEARGNRCSALLGWMHTGEGDRERTPHFSSTILQQCRDIYNNGSLALAALCYWSWSGKPKHTVNLIVVLSTSSKKACILYASHTVMPSVTALISQLNVRMENNKIGYQHNNTGSTLLLLIPIKGIFVRGADNASHLYLVLIYFPQAYWLTNRISSKTLHRIEGVGGRQGGRER